MELAWRRESTSPICAPPKSTTRLRAIQCPPTTGPRCESGIYFCIFFEGNSLSPRPFSVQYIIQTFLLLKICSCLESGEWSDFMGCYKINVMKGFIKLVENNIPRFFSMTIFRDDFFFQVAARTLRSPSKPRCMVHSFSSIHGRKIGRFEICLFLLCLDTSSTNCTLASWECGSRYSRER